jgi:hypothetical protein
MAEQRMRRAQCVRREPNLVHARFADRSQMGKLMVDETPIEEEDEATKRTTDRVDGAGSEYSDTSCSR